MNIASLEVHNYAPELNTLHLNNGIKLPVPGLTTIKDVRAFYFKPSKPGRYVKVTVSNTEYNISRTYQGYVKSYKDVIEFLKGRKEYHNLPGTLFSLSIKTIS